MKLFCQWIWRTRFVSKTKLANRCAPSIVQQLEIPASNMSSGNAGLSHHGAWRCASSTSFLSYCSSLSQQHVAGEARCTIRDCDLGIHAWLHVPHIGDDASTRRVSAQVSPLACFDASDLASELAHWMPYCTMCHLLFFSWQAFNPALHQSKFGMRSLCKRINN